MQDRDLIYVGAMIGIVLALAIAALIGLCAALVASWSGASAGSAVFRGSAAFATALTLILGILTLATFWLQG